MAESYIILVPDTNNGGKNIRAENLTINTVSVYQQVMSVADGVNGNLLYSGSAANLVAKTSANAQIVCFPGCFAVTNAPAANNQASISQAAAGANTRNVCTAVSFSLAQNATGGTGYAGTVNLRDGASGTGTVLQSWYITTPNAALSYSWFSQSGLNIPGSNNTAMTLEFSAAGGANTLECVNLVGYTCV